MGCHVYKYFLAVNANNFIIFENISNLSYMCACISFNDSRIAFTNLVDVCRDTVKTG